MHLGKSQPQKQEKNNHDEIQGSSVQSDAGDEDNCMLINLSWSTIVIADPDGHASNTIESYKNSQL